MYACLVMRVIQLNVFCARNYAWNFSYEIYIESVTAIEKNICDKLNIIVCKIQKVFTHACRTYSKYQNVEMIICSRSRYKGMTKIRRVAT